jgi:hypothetical protein
MINAVQANKANIATVRVRNPPEGWRKRGVTSYAVFPLSGEFDPGGKLSIARVLASSCQNSPHAANRSLI